VTPDTAIKAVPVPVTATPAVDTPIPDMEAPDGPAATRIRVTVSLLQADPGSPTARRMMRAAMGACLVLIRRAGQRAADQMRNSRNRLRPLSTGARRRGDLI
jgi:hypothetical protein